MAEMVDRVTNKGAETGAWQRAYVLYGWMVDWVSKRANMYMHVNSWTSK